jgi:hypothetical protein
MRIAVGAILGLVVGFIACIIVWLALSLLGIPDNVSAVPSGLIVWCGPIAGGFLAARTDPKRRARQQPSVPPDQWGSR